MYISWSCNYNTVNRESKLQQCMASSSSCWPWTSEACHPICSPLLPQLRLHPPSLMSTSSLSYLGRDDSNSREEALSLGSNNAGAEQSLVLANDDAELPLQLRTASWSAEVIHLAFIADLNQLVDIFAAVAQGPRPTRHSRSRKPWSLATNAPVSPAGPTSEGGGDMSHDDLPVSQFPLLGNERPRRTQPCFRQASSSHHLELGFWGAGQPWVQPFGCQLSFFYHF